jgi:butyrate kinase
MKELPRVSLSHALNIKMIGKRYALENGEKYSDLNLVIAHLGGGISITAHRKGQMIDVNNANDDGPFSPQRCGSLPMTGLVKLCYSGKYTQKEMFTKLLKKGGVYSLLGTDDMIEVEKKAESDAKFDLVQRAFAYNVAKEIGAYATTLKGKVDAILITGGIAFSNPVVSMVRDYVEWIAPVHIYPGEDEMEGLVRGTLRVLDGREETKEYK